MADLVVYDVEATDADPRHGQITQFGAVRTDLALNPVEETEVHVRRLPWVVPMPKALEVTGTAGPSALEGPGRVSEFEAAGIMEKALVPAYGNPRTMVTFNGIDFDDELLRTTFFRNLRSPWFSSGKLTTRIDLLNLVRLAAAADPSSVALLAKEDGRPSWRLEDLCRANGIKAGGHDAVGDAHATLALAKAIRASAGWAWDAASACGRRERLESLLGEAARHGTPMYLFKHFGRAEVVPCAVLGTDGRRRWIMADLRREAGSMSRDEIAGHLFTPDTPFPVARATAAPLFVDPDRAVAIDPTLDPVRIEAKAAAIKGTGICAEAIEALKGRGFAEQGSRTSEEGIYGGFPPERDKPQMTAFLRARGWQERAGIAFQDPRLADFAARIVLEAEHYGECSLDAGTAGRLRAVCAEALARPDAGEGARWATVRSAIEDGAGEEWKEWARAAFPSAPAWHDDGRSVQMELSL